MRQAIATPSARAELRTWPLDESMRHIAIVDVSMVPTPQQVHGWLAAAYASPARVKAVRTGALYPAAAAVFEACGFTAVDRLVLLERTLLGHQPRRSRQTRASTLRRVRRRDLETLAEIDQAAFPAGWRNDVTSLGEIVDATPTTRRRLARMGSRFDSRALGFAITGRAGTTGYLQRIAVIPEARRLGVGRQLVDDATEWLMRRGANRALVNTGVHNLAALRMYEHASFERLDDQLVVMEHRRTP